jgi:hypothetical protein
MQPGRVTRPHRIKIITEIEIEKENEIDIEKEKNLRDPQI